MTKKFFFVLVVILVFCMLFSACTSNRSEASTPTELTPKNTITLVIETSSEQVISVDLDSLTIDNGLESILDNLNISYEISDGIIMRLDSLESSADPLFLITIFTSVADDQESTSYAYVENYNGVVLKSINKEMKDLSFSNEAIILIKLIKVE